MFILVEFEDVVKIKPSLFKDSLEASISDALNKKLANKVFTALLFQLQNVCEIHAILLYRLYQTLVYV